MRAVLAKSAPSDVFVLDFDGVIVDSEPEVSLAGVRAAQAFWPDVFDTDMDLEQMKQRMRQTRPAVVAGYETMVMARLLHTGTNPQEILHAWPSMLDRSLSEWGVTRKQLEPYMEKARTEWMENSTAEYLDAHEVYPGVQATLQMCEFPYYIASSKQGHRVSKVMTTLVGVPLPADSPRLFAGLLPPNEKKVETLRIISERPMCKSSGARLHFVDDRLETLKAVQEHSDLDQWNLWFADWGYNTEAEKEDVRKQQSISSINLKQFLELLKWGVVMGVDDGCEPEAHEVQAQISQDHGLPERR